ncbi:LysR family transcriptional regulator [Pseudogulbenkiania subflava]|uniref:DNA-binding transcriptional regulator, LysR family n=1 Tax=Pseudogulbenkiania subflava DSM 22618 TaxID=1123014 RepID=A0A1Y6BBW9_9NEIS|nr:LysR family transcriptional regulator [Pseudogulbenkiania subflava]SME92974.1 DNA-binding transcriptional regulator, LysR family [Pseudogulbenkiania subflava DSM 22618]
MDLSDLTVFCTVVEAGGVTRAAERLHRVQSNITTRIRKLEQDLGVDLFEREGRQLVLTADGERLLGYARQLLGLAAAARDDLAGQRLAGRFRLGSMENTAATRLPLPLSRFHRDYPEVELELSTGPSLPMCQRVLRGEVDAALVAEPVGGGLDPRLDSRVIGVEELVLVTALDHPPVRDARDVAQDTLLAFQPGCGYRQRLEDWFASAGRLPQRQVELSSYHAMLGCAAAGMGVALVPEKLLDQYAGQAALARHRLPLATARAPTLLVWKRSQPRAVIARFAEYLLEDETAPS